MKLTFIKRWKNYIFFNFSKFYHKKFLFQDIMEFTLCHRTITISSNFITPLLPPPQISSTTEPSPTPSIPPETTIFLSPRPNWMTRSNPFTSSSRRKWNSKIIPFQRPTNKPRLTRRLSDSQIFTHSAKYFPALVTPSNATRFVPGVKFFSGWWRIR